MTCKRFRHDVRISAMDRRCLAAILEAELNGTPVNAHTWRAKNAKFILRLPDLMRGQLLTLKDNTQYVITLYGLMRLGGERAGAALSLCARLFRSLRKHYTDHPSEPISAGELAKRLKVAQGEVRQSAHFLSRSPVYLSIQADQKDVMLIPNENYVMLKSFDGI